MIKSLSLPLAAGFTAEVDTVDEVPWYAIGARFADFNIYQTWAYDVTRWGRGSVSHLVLKRDGEITAAAQLRLALVPLTGRGAAYLRWGPFWQCRGATADPAVFQNMLRALRNEYAVRRGLYLRIFPTIYGSQADALAALEPEGFNRTNEDSGRTLLLDIRPGLQELRQNLDRKWRNGLTKAEQNGLEVVVGTDDTLFAEFIEVYRELLDRKKFHEPNDIRQFRAIQQDLPPAVRMRIILCRFEGRPAAGGICAAVGDTGIYMFGATNRDGMNTKGSYLVQWHAVQSMKEAGCSFYNLNGINPEANPGTYHFKAGLAGKRGIDIQYAGRFDAYASPLIATLARTAERLWPRIERVRRAVLR